MPSERRVESAARSRRSASGCSPRAGSLCGQTMRKLAVALPCARADPVEQRLAENGLVREDENVDTRARRDVRDDVLDRPLAGDLADLVDEVLAQPAGLRLRMRRDDDLVDLLRGEHVLDRGERLVVEDAAVRRDARAARSAASVRSSLRPAAARRESR